MENNVTLLADTPDARNRFKHAQLIFTTTLADGDKQTSIETRRLDNYLYTIIERYSLTREDERTRVWDDCTFVPPADIVRLARYFARIHSVYLSRRVVAITPLNAQRLVEQLLVKAHEVVIND